MKEENEHKVLNTKQDFDDFLYKTPYLAFLDILGFKALVKNNSHDALVKLYEKIFTEEVEKVDSMIKQISKKQTEKLGEQYTDAGIRMVNISDSIMIWTQHGQPSALFEIVFAVSTLLGISIIQGLPLRGCITRQSFSVIEKNSVLSVIGKGLVHAYDKELIQQWSGCMIDMEIINYFRSIEKVINRRDRPSPIERNFLVYEYAIPIKEDSSEIGYAVNWSDPKITDDMIRKAFEAHNKKDERPKSDTPQKIENTLEFHHFCLEKKKTRDDEIRKFNEAMDKIEKKDK